jgi:hypothetical protein
VQPAYINEVMAKGTAFEFVVNSCNADKDFQAILLTEKTIAATYKIQNGDNLFEKEFIFDNNLILSINELLLQRAVYTQQHYCNRILELPSGLVIELYGYIDYVAPTSIIDLKTTKKYLYPHYINN